MYPIERISSYSCWVPLSLSPSLSLVLQHLLPLWTMQTQNGSGSVVLVEALVLQKCQAAVAVIVVTDVSALTCFAFS